MNFYRLFITVLCVLPSQVYAINGDSEISQYSYAQCILKNARHYQINADLITAIIKTESDHQPDAININTSGSEDVGLMQINSEWLPKIKIFGYDRNSLFDPCTNITVGTWILAQEINRFGYSWKAVGAYNAGPSKSKESRRASYANRVYNNLSQ
jgi:soluble lytic murein transglycosylase-like protein